jgi:hypothetical protein
MKIRGVFVIAGLTLMGMVSGCKSDPSSPQNSNNADQVSFETVNSDLGLMKNGGMDYDSSAGVFSIGWNEMFRPFENSGEVRGNAFAVAFGEDQTDLDHFKRYGLDMGNVYINYAGNQIQLIKKYHRIRGTAYTLFERLFGPCGPDSLLQFIPNTEYQFEVTGSSVFAPVTISVTSPASLIDITSHTSGNIINPSEDLTLTWTGGNSDQKTMIRLMPHMRPERGPRHGGHMFPPGPPPFDRVVLIVLENNPGTYTIPASQIQEMLNGLESDGIMVEVSQVDKGEVSHPNGVLKTAMRNCNTVNLRLSL